jgi:type II secretory pathway pseudopilin PulG
MNKDFTIAAFTIVEAVVSMAVTAIILAIVFIIFSFTSQRLLDFKKQNEATSDLNRMSYTINRGIFESENMYATENSLVFSDYEGTRTRYEFSEKYLLRVKGDFIDTFHLSVNKMILDTLTSGTKKQVYQRLKCSINTENSKPVSLNFYKRIYPATLLKAIKK